MKLESASLPSPRNARPCLKRNRALDSNFRKHCLRSNRCFASWEDSISPTLPVVAGRVMVFNTASLWHWLASCLLYLVVASFQLENPVEMNVCSRLETERRWLFWYATTHVKQNARSLSYHSEATTISRTIEVGKNALPQRSSRTLVGGSENPLAGAAYRLSRQDCGSSSYLDQQICWISISCSFACTCCGLVL